MKVTLFNDKQVCKIVNSIKHFYTDKFNKAKDEISALLDEEVDRQMQSTEVAEYKQGREEMKKIICALLDLQKKVKEIEPSHRIEPILHYNNPFKINSYKEEVFNEKTEQCAKELALKLAKQVLGIDDSNTRKQSLIDDITARVAVMGIYDYDTIVVKLNEQIDIKNYFKPL